MRAGNAGLSAHDGARLADSFRLLQQGRIADAQAIADDIARHAPGAPQVLHIQALCRRAGGDVTGALQAFEGALAGAPADASLLNNYANLLRQQGRLRDAIAAYRTALRSDPAHEARLNLGLALQESGDPAAARTELQEMTRRQPRSTRAWHALGGACRALGDLAEAEAAYRQALALSPGSAPLWINCGVVHRLQGDAAQALGCYERARRAGHAGPELADAEASAWLDLGEPERALELARELVAAFPDYAPGHLLHAQLLWEHGPRLAPGEDAVDSLRRAARSRPGNAALGQTCLRFLIDTRNTALALEQVRALRAAGDSGHLAMQEAEVLDRLGDTPAAGALIAQLHGAMSGQPEFLNLAARHLLKCGDAAAAARRAQEALALEPDNQQSLAWLSIAWRLLGDAREHWLCAYEELVAEHDVEPPAQFGDTGAFLRALEHSVLPLHQATREPADQSLRGGSQTSGPLLGRRDPVLAATRDALMRAVHHYVTGLREDPDHPFLRRRRSHTRLAGSWSVRLASAGRHVSHFHQKGWISSAFYVSLPDSVASSTPGSTAGWLQFGEPPAELGLSLPPRRMAHPAPGRLVLFPSYLWHGTVPFHDTASRLTLAFDVVPAARA